MKPPTELAVRAETRSFYHQAVARAVERIVGDLDQALVLEALASDACLSPFHFHRVFRGMVGETPLELMRRLRMERAAWRLIESDRPVTEIAFDAGYETHEAFTRAFRACYSTSPSGFRRRPRARVELAATSGLHFDPAGTSPVFTPHDSGGRTMQVEIKDMPELRVGTVRHIGPYNLIYRGFERLGAIVGPAGLLRDPSQTMMLAIYHDDPECTPLEKLRSDAGLTVPDGTPLPDGLEEQRIAGGRYASTVHEGPYARLGDTWARFMGEWLPASGRRLGAGPSYEVYQNTPENVPEEELRTELYVPLAC